MIKAASMPYRGFILQLNKRASECNYGDRLEEQLCDRLIGGINNISLRPQMSEKKGVTLSEVRKSGFVIDLIQGTVLSSYEDS
ncbi:unnamed protein product [Echinostoma caproni]|uniref:Transposase n=1 Tax=Echinostoma caproni TaxID=27848 RepID=A0A183ALU5_9TREM|nr:unnamed protein product [Echinostoma caproni]